MIQWISSWLVWISKTRIRAVSTYRSKGKKSPFVVSVNGMIGKEDLFILTTFSQIMAEKHEESI